VSRLEQVFDAIDAKPQGKTCDAILGIIEEAQEIMAPPRRRSNWACRTPLSFWRPRCARKRRPTRR
jgi:hypothetical protein